METLTRAISVSSGHDTSVQWRLFLRAMVDEIDSIAIVTERDDMLRGIGARMARSIPLPGVTTLGMLEMEINEALAALGWGHAGFHLDEQEQLLTITHNVLPRIGSAGDPPGTWLSAVLEGLYETWLNAQSGAQAGFTARRSTVGANSVMLQFGRL